MVPGDLVDRPCVIYSLRVVGGWPYFGYRFATTVRTTAALLYCGALVAPYSGT